MRSAIIADRREAKNNIAILLGKTAKPKAFQEKSMHSQIVKMPNDSLINSENRYKLSFAVFLVCWILLGIFIPESTYWRDSAEFVMSAFHLDIAHPAGFPTYSTLANLFALLPFGPIAWRVNGFSAFLSALNLALVFLLTQRLMRRCFALSLREAALLALIPVVSLVCSPFYIKQSFFAEVYLLNSTLVFVLLLLYDSYRRAGDLRYLIGAAFIAGLALGNHVSVSLVILAALAVILSPPMAVKKAIVPALLFGIVGVVVYGYVPVRAATSPVLNTGEVTTLTRFYYLISNARGRALKDDVAMEVLEGSLGNRALYSFAAVFAKDVKALSEEFRVGVLACAVLGLLFLGFKDLRMFLVLTLAGLSNWIFFRGWNPDPWIVMLSILSLGVGMFASAILCARHSKGAIRPVLSLIIFGIFTFSSLRGAEFLDYLWRLKDFELAAASVSRVLKELPYRTVFLVEHSRFLMRYAREIEGIRRDVALVYQPALLYPEYFEGVRLKRENSDTFDSRAVGVAVDGEGKSIFGRFIEYASKTSLIAFEPAEGTSKRFSSIAVLTDRGISLIERGVAGSFSPQYLEVRTNEFAQFVSALRGLERALLADSRLYLEARLSNESQLLEQIGQPQSAMTLLEQICLPLPETVCTPVLLNNLAVKYMQLRDYETALKLLLRAVALDEGSRETLKLNIKVSLSKIPRDRMEMLLGELSPYNLGL